MTQRSPKQHIWVAVVCKGAPIIHFPKCGIWKATKWCRHEEADNDVKEADNDVEEADNDVEEADNDMEEADNDVEEADNDMEEADNLRGRKQNHVMIDY